VITFNKILFLY